MEKVGGRPRDDVWHHVELLPGGRRVKCKYCGYEFAASANRIKSHINRDKGKGIRVCTGFPRSNSSGSHGERSNDLSDNVLPSQQEISSDGLIDFSISNGAAQTEDDANYQEGIPSPVPKREINEDSLKYVFECLSPEDEVFRSPLSLLTQEKFATLKPETYLDSLVIDIFVEMLNHIERRKKKSTPSNWYLPVTFSKAPFEDSTIDQMMIENYMFDPKSCEKMFIPIHMRANSNGGHFYLYIIHLKKEEIEIWDSLHNTSVAETERGETTEKLLRAMENLFPGVAFTKFRSKMADDIPRPPNEFDCGIFVIKFMEQSNDFVKRNPLFQFDSKKEREDLAIKLLNSDLNLEKKNLYEKTRRYYAQVESQERNKRLRVGGDGLEKGSSKGRILPTTDLKGQNFQCYSQRILNWIMDDKVSTIGVWGAGGSGKTALATHICGKLLEEPSGDIKVIWVTVSQNSIHTLQKVIARSIKLDIPDELEDKIIAIKLSQALKEMEKCVIILDDVWDHFFLKEVGFPMSNNRIKLILTTRIREVCQSMDCERVIEVKSLDKKDSWALFKKFSGFHEKPSLEVENIAWNVAKECGGLPLAIVRIATSMKGKTQAREWSHMLECLENLGNGQYEMDKWVFPVLRSSYDFLNEKLQRFFLYCVLSSDSFGDGSVDHLIRRFVYESDDKTKKLRVQYNEGYSMLYKLKNHSMLDYDGCEWKISKFLRVLAIGIAEDTSTIMGKAYKNLMEIPSDDQWKEDLQQVFLTGNKIRTIPNGTCPRCSQLSMLLLDRNVKLNYISDDFFSNMPALKTLDLSKTRIKRLPNSVSNLECLIALLLSGCVELSYIPSLRKLKRLISLDLSRTAITEAPVGLESLYNLRCLNLLHTYKLIIPALSISELINLECLQLGCACSVDVTVQSIQGLEKLGVLVGYFRDISVFNPFVSMLARNRVIRSYHLICASYGSHFDDGKEIAQINKKYSTKRITFMGMDLGNREAVLPGDIKDLFMNDCHQRTGTGSLCSVLSYARNNKNPHLIELLSIRCCEDVEYLCCCSSICPFCSSSQLVARLCLNSLKNLKNLVCQSTLFPHLTHLSVPSHQSTLFSHLTNLSVRRCNNMETLMMPKLLADLKNLSTISVSHCGKMKEMVGVEEEGTRSGDLMAIVSYNLPRPPISLPKLTSLKLYDLPKLNFVYRGIMLCPSLQTFSAKGCKQLNVPQIKTSNDGFELSMLKTSTGYCW